VLVISIIIWLGIFYYLFQIDKKITKLEKMAEINNFNQNNE
jgi:CcmD family protein